MNQPAEKKRTLVDIVLELREVLWHIDESEGVLDDELEQQLDHVEAALESKVENCLRVFQEYEAIAAVHDERAKIQANKAKALKNAGARLKAYVVHAMQLADIQRLSTETFPVVRLQKAGPKVEVDPLMFLPWANREGEIDLLRIKDPEPDKTAIRERLKAGDEIPGCQLTEGSVSLRFK